MAAAAVVMPHLDDGVLSEIFCRLPSEDAHRVAAVCQQWRAVLCQPTFLCRHLWPRPLPLLDDGRPCALIIQPRRRARFTHLRLVAVDPADRVPVNVPLQPKYTVPKNTECPSNLFDIANATPRPPLEDYVVFFERTVPMLNIAIVASHGKLLLCCSRTRYYVCDPAANRWLALPPSTVSPSSDANSGMYWNLDASTGWLALTVVLLVRRRRRRVLVDTFSSATGRWDARELAAPGAARCLPGTSPGIHAGTCFYWLSRRCRRQGAVRHILRYDATRCLVSVLREPPLAEKAKDRTRWSLGSVAGGLRLCTFDVRDGSDSRLFCHGDDIEGVHGVWLMDASSSAWRRVHESSVGGVTAYYSMMVLGAETPVDFAGACGEFILVVKWARLSRYDLESRSKVELARLEVGSGRLDTLYQRYNAFPFFK